MAKKKNSPSGASSADLLTRIARLEGMVAELLAQLSGSLVSQSVVVGPAQPPLPNLWNGGRNAKVTKKVKSQAQPDRDGWLTKGKKGRSKAVVSKGEDGDTVMDAGAVSKPALRLSQGDWMIPILEVGDLKPDCTGVAMVSNTQATSLQELVRG